MSSTHLRSIAGRLVAVAMLIAAVAACSGTPAASYPALDAAEARAWIDHALQAVNDRDYQAHTRDWSSAMRSIGREADWLAIRDEVIGRYGRYEQIDSIASAPAQTDGFVRWTAQLRFERAIMPYSIIVRATGGPIEGVDVGIDEAHMVAP